MARDGPGHGRCERSSTAFSTCCGLAAAWRSLPSDLPPWGTIYRWFAKFRDDGLLEKINQLSASWPIASGSDARPARAARLSTARASRRPRLVAPAATMRASRGASARRWSTPTGAASCSRRIREYPGPRWWRAAAVRLTRLVSVHREARIVAAGATSLGRLDALAVDNRAARAGLASDPLAIGHDQKVVDLLKEAVVAELSEPAIDRAPRW